MVVLCPELGSSLELFANKKRSKRASISMSEKSDVDAVSQDAIPSLSDSRRSSRSEHAQDPENSSRLNKAISHACEKCRQRRSKCDGQKPCERCKMRGTHCIYKARLRQTKAQLKAEIAALRQRQRVLDQLFSDLIRPERREELIAYIRDSKFLEDGFELDNLGRRLSRSGTDMAESASTFSRKSVPSTCGTHPQTRARVGSPERIADEHRLNQCNIGKDETQLWILKPSCKLLQSTLRSDFDTESTPQPKARTRPENPNFRQILEWQQGIYETGQLLTELDLDSAMTWTDITSDTEFIRHLLALYFCWEYPNFTPISKEHFLRDFQDTRQQYCSPMLVNALLALGCHLSDRPLAAADNNSIGNTFLNESRRILFSTPDHHQVTTIQSLVIMSLREARCGRFLESKYYAEHAMQLAIEMGLHNVREEDCALEPDVRTKTFWGTFTLNHAWAMVKGELPHCLPALHRPPMPVISTDFETSSWAPYADGDVYFEPHKQLSNVRSLYQYFCKLNETVHESLHLLYSPAQSLTAANLLQNYHLYLDWYDQMPEVMRLGHNSTPAAIFIHLYYHLSVLLLFRPFLRVRLLGSGILPLEICFQAADAMQRLVGSYSKLYTLRRTPAFMPFFSFASATICLATSTMVMELDHGKVSVSPTPDVNESLRLSIAHLEEMAPYHSFAEQAPHILRYLSRRWSLEVDVKARKGPLLNARLNIMLEHTLGGTGLEDAIGTEGTGTKVHSFGGIGNFSALLGLQQESVLRDGFDLAGAGFSLL
ncbi:Nitrogen assimilation transcription factor nit-4 [Beauveria bassiana]|nr:Nitrogen assimilation transcription factor nit-4 [Beauveria bassiana]